MARSPHNERPWDADKLLLNAVEIRNAESMAWQGRKLVFQTPEGSDCSPAQSKELVSCAWDLWRENRGTCSGYGYVGPLGKSSVMVPEGWRFPTGRAGGLVLVSNEPVTVSWSNPQDRRAVCHILAEGVKRHFKQGSAEGELGPLWQFYSDFCECPDFRARDGISTCRLYGVKPKVLADGRLLLLFHIGTRSFEARSLADYISSADLSEFVSKCKLRQEMHSTRKGLPGDVNLLLCRHQLPLRIVKLETPGDSLGDSYADGAGNPTVRCSAFRKPPADFLASDLHFVLEPSELQGGHRRAILSPEEREDLLVRLVRACKGLEIHGLYPELADDFVSFDGDRQSAISPPTIIVKAANDREKRIPGDGRPSELKRRARERAMMVARHGFVRRGVIAPVLAWPSSVCDAAGKRILADFNHLMRVANTGAKFGRVDYRSVPELVQGVVKAEGTAALVVLAGDSAQQSKDHDQIKRDLDIPSQCIRLENTLPRSWIDKPVGELKANNRRLYKQMRERYWLCLSNLLVKAGWLPFRSADPFSYNVHIGVDVGGKGNDSVVLSLGYGFRQDELNGPVFRAVSLPTDAGRMEPIPEELLRDGLLNLFDAVGRDLRDLDVSPDFSSCLFIRDGAMLGNAEVGRERHAISAVYKELPLTRDFGEVGDWSVACILKRASHWRAFRTSGPGGRFANPIVGQCIEGLESADEALVCLTGSPHLTQGTAKPIVVRVDHIGGDGTMRGVLHDLVWESDMCFTKLDLSSATPFILNLADSGAYIAARGQLPSGLAV